MKTDTPTILIIIGITGDLSHRKLLPALSEIVQNSALPSLFHIVGLTRQEHITTESVLKSVTNSTLLEDKLTVMHMDFAAQESYKELSIHLEKIEASWGTTAQRLFYLSVPPQASPAIIEFLGSSTLAQVPQTKLLLEKPFGVDLESATDLLQKIHTYFTEENVYRIDHYVAKEMAQNIMIFRENNSLFRNTWNADFIERIEIIASEEIGIEGRALFYEGTGALRDLIQSHLLQLAALTLMSGKSTTDEDVPLRRLSALKNMFIPTDKPLTEYVRRGQYESYTAEVHNTTSTVETYVELTVFSKDPKWSGVPITVITGKKLPEKTTEIRLFYKKDTDEESSELIINLQSDEGIRMSIQVKHPGYEKKSQKEELQFSHKNNYPKLPEAYEHVLLDVINSDHTLFVSGDEVLESWRILAPVQDAWKESSDDLLIYKDGVLPMYR